MNKFNKGDRVKLLEGFKLYYPSNVRARSARMISQEHDNCAVTFSNGIDYIIPFEQLRLVNNLVIMDFVNKRIIK